MEKVKKVTKKERFEMIKEIVLNANVEDKNEMIEFINREIELLNKKRTSGSKTAKQKENDEFGALSNQKVSALMKMLKSAGKVVRVDDKKKAYFSIAE